jgi:hypothetical protein
MYTYRCHNTKHVHVLLSQYKTCTLVTVTTQTCKRATSYRKYCGDLKCRSCYFSNSTLLDNIRQSAFIFEPPSYHRLKNTGCLENLIFELLQYIMMKQSHVSRFVYIYGNLSAPVPTFQLLQRIYSLLLLNSAAVHIPR